MDRSTFVQGALAVAAASALIVLLTQRDGGEAHGHATDVVQAQHAPPTAPLAGSMREPVAPAPVERSAAELLLEDFYGAEADAVRAEAIAAGVDLATYPCPIPEGELRAVLPAWFTFKQGELDTKVAELDSWPEELTGAWLADRFGLVETPDANALAIVAGVAEPHNLMIRDSIEEYLFFVEQGLQFEVQRGNVDLWPIVTRRKESPDGTFYMLMRSGQGWNTAVSMTRQDHPEVVQAQAFMHDLIRQRDAAVRQTLYEL